MRSSLHRIQNQESMLAITRKCSQKILQDGWFFGGRSIVGFHCQSMRGAIYCSTNIHWFQTELLISCRNENRREETTRVREKKGE